MFGSLLHKAAAQVGAAAPKPAPQPAATASTPAPRRSLDVARPQTASRPCHWGFELDGCDPFDFLVPGPLGH
jgi:hypothetical protein